MPSRTTPNTNWVIKGGLNVKNHLCWLWEAWSGKGVPKMQSMQTGILLRIVTSAPKNGGALSSYIDIGLIFLCSVCILNSFWSIIYVLSSLCCVLYVLSVLRLLTQVFFYILICIMYKCSPVYVCFCFSFESDAFVKKMKLFPKKSKDERWKTFFEKKDD